MEEKKAIFTVYSDLSSSKLTSQDPEVRETLNLRIMAAVIGIMDQDEEFFRMMMEGLTIYFTHHDEFAQLPKNVIVPPAGGSENVS